MTKQEIRDRMTAILARVRAKEAADALALKGKPRSGRKDPSVWGAPGQAARGSRKGNVTRAKAKPTPLPDVEDLEEEP